MHDFVTENCLANLSDRNKKIRENSFALTENCRERLLSLPKHLGKTYFHVQKNWVNLLISCK